MRPGLTIGAIAGEWLVVAAAIAIAELVAHWSVTVLAMLVIGIRFHALGILGHEAAHYRVHKNRWLNNVIGEICFLPNLWTMHGFRGGHRLHHTRTNTRADPDFLFIRTWLPAKIDKTYLFLVGPLMVSSLLLYVPGYFSSLRWYYRFQFRHSASAVFKYAVWFGVLLVCAATGSLVELLIYGFVPIFAIYPLVNGGRVIAEHHGDLDHSTALAGSRTTKPTWFEALTLFPYHVGYHIEHHLFPSVPWHNLPDLHDRLMGTPRYAGSAHVTDGYHRFIRHEADGAAVKSVSIGRLDP